MGTWTTTKPRECNFDLYVWNDGRTCIRQGDYGGPTPTPADILAWAGTEPVEVRRSLWEGLRGEFAETPAATSFPLAPGSRWDGEAIVDSGGTRITIDSTLVRSALLVVNGASPWMLDVLALASKAGLLPRDESAVRERDELKLRLDAALKRASDTERLYLGGERAREAVHCDLSRALDERDALKAQLEAVTKERDALKAQLAAAQESQRERFVLAYIALGHELDDAKRLAGVLATRWRGTSA